MQATAVYTRKVMKKVHQVGQLNRNHSNASTVARASATKLWQSTIHQSETAVRHGPACCSSNQ